MPMFLLQLMLMQMLMLIGGGRRLDAIDMVCLAMMVALQGGFEFVRDGGIDTVC